MRDHFVAALNALATKDRNVLLITGDLGFGVLTKYAEQFSNQYLNVGVAEQNMAGLATGMALEGKTVFTYSIANFPTLRCLEQIRNDICYHQASVKIVAIGGGFSYGALGMSHHATEDLAIMRALPNMTVVAPGDVVEAAAATQAVYERPGPCYLRLGRGGEPTIHQEKISFEIGKAIKLYEGEDVTLISSGGILQNALAAREQLVERGLDVGLYSMHTLKPLDEKAIKYLADRSRLIVTLEEHSTLGGLGGAVSEVLAELPAPRARLKRLGLNDCFSSLVGDQDYLRDAYGLSVDGIANTVLAEIYSLKTKTL